MVYKIRDLSKKFGKHYALKNIDLDISENEKIVIIHGKGEGVLRQALLQELKKKYPRCQSQDASFREYGFGATQVTIH